MTKHLISIIATLTLLSNCSETPKETVNPVDGRVYSYDQDQWNECIQNNKIMALKIEYTDHLSALKEDENASTEDNNAFKENCYLIEETVWCKKDSNAGAIMSMLSQNMSAELAKCCFQANGDFLREIPEEKYLSLLSSREEGEGEGEGEGIFDNLLDNTTSVITPVVNEKPTDENDALVLAYELPFSIDFFGMCSPK